MALKRGMEAEIMKSPVPYLAMVITLIGAVSTSVGAGRLEMILLTMVSMVLIFSSVVMNKPVKQTATGGRRRRYGPRLTHLLLVAATVPLLGTRAGAYTHEEAFKNT